MSPLLISGQNWGELTQLLNENSAALNYFGISVDVDGEFAVVGCPGFDSSRGQVYIYRYVNQEWVEFQTITQDNLMPNDRFGGHVSIHGNYMVVGALGVDEDENDEMPLDGAGAAYIYKLVGDEWLEQQKIVASDRQVYGGFGDVVSINGEYIAIGVPREGEDENGENTLQWAGATYIFKREGDTWSEQQKIVAPDRAIGDSFGGKLAITDNYLAVSATGEDQDENGMNTLNGAGAVYIFNLQGETWHSTQMLVPSVRQLAAEFGSALDFDNNTLVIGAKGEDTLFGAAYIFTLEGSDWNQEQRLTASDRAFADGFGNTVSLKDNVLVIGAQQEDEDINQENTMPGSGSAYIFDLESEWVEVQKIVASDRSEGFQFGSVVCSASENIFVGSIGYGIEDQIMVGSVYIFNTCATLTLDEIPSTTTACSGESVFLNASSNLGQVNWYESSADSEPIFTGNEFESPELIEGINTFWIDASNDNCTTPRVEIEIDALPSPSISIDETEFEVCHGNSVQFSAQSANGVIYWFDSPNSETFVSSGNTLFLANIQSATTYWAEARNLDSGCSSERIAILAEPIPTPAPPEAESPQVFSASALTLADLVVGLDSDIYTWYADEDLTTILSETTAIQNGSTYFITQTINGCESNATPILVEIILSTDVEPLDNLKLFPNPTSQDLFIQTENLMITSIHVYDMHGQTVFQSFDNSEERIVVPLNDLSSGLYLVSVEAENRSRQFKVIKN